ncbi:MAG: 2-hydroxyacyl-CoA dehydratase [Oscillospiraceae bacterium]|nr:2-hydroxyacyl-CoA dehydratase [Oscillospiraceae bacterium]
MEKVLFTKEMRDAGYTILVPDMNHIHFKIIKGILQNHGYNVDILYNTGRSVVDEGLKHVHNDTCYPALLVIGQMIDALKSGKYDIHKVALLLPQTGGGCRASNYISLLRKALNAMGWGFIPIISINVSGLEKSPGFKLTPGLVRQMLTAVVYGDLLMLLDNQVKPYEVNKGDSAACVDMWINALLKGFLSGRGLSKGERRENLKAIVQSFARIPRTDEKKIKVGIVGEIYVKYAALGNNSLEQFLYEQGCEVMLGGLLDFALYCVDTPIDTIDIYGGSKLTRETYKLVESYLCSLKDEMIAAVRENSDFVAPSSFRHLKSKADGVISTGCKMGEGWLLTAEIMELVELGYCNVICAQPFGCLPNHIVGKGMIRKIRNLEPRANIVPIDYDPGATRVNQENRIKLMLAVAAEDGDTAAAESEVHDTEIKETVNV